MEEQTKKKPTPQRKNTTKKTAKKTSKQKKTNKKPKTATKLTLKQKNFCDYYIELGNASEAYKKAYSCENESTCKSNGSKNLQKPAIKKYIDARLKAIESERIATVKEVMEFYTATMRGETADRDGQSSSLTDRLRAATELMKRLEAGEETAKTTSDTKILFKSEHKEEKLPENDEMSEWSE